MSENKIFKLTDKNGTAHYFVSAIAKKDLTIARIAQSIKLGSQYDEWWPVYEDIMLQNKAVVRLSQIYLVQEIGGVGCD